jgi:hypothetical protein
MNSIRDVLQTLNAAEEVQIEPRSVDGRSGQPVTIWVVVVDGDVYVRSYKGPQGRWYQALLTHPEGVLHADGLEIPFRAVKVEDAQTIARVSEAYRRKYERLWPKETADMLRTEVVRTTLRLEPVGEQAA